jgi:AraC family transcriptional regulator
VGGARRGFFQQRERAYSLVRFPADPKLPEACRRARLAARDGGEERAMEERVLLKADGSRPALRWDGPPIGGPEWAGATHSNHVAFVLRPPVDSDLAYEVDRYLLVLPFSGGTWNLSVGDAPPARIRVRAGSLMLVPPGAFFRARQAEPVEVLVLAVDPSHVARTAERATRDRAWGAPAIMDLVDPGVAAIAHEIRRSLLADPILEPVYLETLVDAVVTRLVCLTGERREHRSARETLSPGKLRRIVRHIEDGIAGPLTVEGLARLAGLSRSHFSRAFQVATGDPPQRFILKRRLCRARDLLGSPVLALAEIAARAGFSSQAHMSTAFRQHLGVTPGMYRAAARRR